MSTVEQQLEELESQYDAISQEIEDCERRQDEIMREQDRIAKTRWSEQGVLLNQTEVRVDGYDEDFVIVEALGPHWVMVSSVQTDQILQVPAKSVRLKG